MSDKSGNSKSGAIIRRVIIRLHDYVRISSPDQVVKLIEADKFGPWQALRDEFPGIRVRPRWKAQKPKQIDALIEKARDRDPNYRPGPFLSYFEIHCPNDSDVTALDKTLSSWPTIAQSWVDPGPVAPPVMPMNDPRWPQQGYLDPAPDGINAEFAWTIPGGDGAGQGFVDLERGWTLDHEDLAAHGATVISGVSQDYHGHGTAVLGEVGAVDNAIGCVGIAPELDSVRVVSQWRTATDYDTADAVLDAAANMEFGHVLLLEAQTTMGAFSYVPVEVYDDTFEAIRLATALGIIVVEAAGNGGNDLDTFTNLAGLQILNPASADFRDSGAIMVGAASSSAPHARMGFSCYGGRVDCYGWGENIDTTGDGWTGTSTSAYTPSFGGTSGASPIVTGAALALQGIAEAGPGIRFSPAQMRALLTDPAMSTPSANPPIDRIGVMPDLGAIIAGGVVNMRPDVYLRDYVGDDGDPHAAAISASPDIILLPATVTDPTAAYGEGSGTENSNTEGYEATDGQDNFIYVRCRNRGGVAAANAVAQVFWSPPSTLVTPDLWTPVGSVTLPNVPAGDTLVVSDALTWPDAEIPAPGHYCFVAILGHPQDPGPDPTDFLNWDNFRAFIRNNNNVTWRNFNVVPNTPPPGAKASALPFIMPGALDKTRRMRLEVAMRLPKGSKAALAMPDNLAQRFLNERTPYVKASKGIANVPLNPHGRTRFLDVALPPKVRHSLTLNVHIPEGERDHSYLCWAQQFEGEEEVGRVTWRLAAKAELQKRDERLKKAVGKGRA